MKYITGQFALNLPCSLETCGDWHTSAMNWDNLRFSESDDSIFGDYGIETCDCVPEHEGVFYVADTLRALLDLLIEGRFSVAQGAKDDFICNDSYTKEFFEKVYQLKSLSQWNKIDKFMEKEYELEWLDYRRARDKESL